MQVVMLSNGNSPNRSESTALVRNSSWTICPIGTRIFGSPWWFPTRDESRYVISTAFYRLTYLRSSIALNENRVMKLTD